MRCVVDLLTKNVYEFAIEVERNVFFSFIFWKLLYY